MNTDILQPPQLSIGKLLLLGVSSLLMCVSMVMSLFAPFPLALGIVLYGRAKGYLVGLLMVAFSYLFAAMVDGDHTLFGVAFCVFIFGCGIAEVTVRGISPVKGIVALGLGFLVVCSAAFALMLSSLKVTPKQFIIQQIEKSADKLAEQKKLVELSGDKDSLEVLQLLDRPESLAKEVIDTFPGYFFMGIFLLLWFNMFLVLKSRRLLFSGNHYEFDEKSLQNFKVPFGLVFLLVAGLVLAIWGGAYGSVFELAGLTIIRTLGVFYFFQGFGVFIELLNFIGVAGFLRTIMVVLTVLIANYLIAVAGLFDNWFDFRKYFVKRNTDDLF